MTVERVGEHRTIRRAELSIVLLVVLLLAFTVSVLAAGPLLPALVNDRFDITIQTVSMLIAGGVAALAWARGRVTNEPAAHLRASAFTVLAVVNLATLVVGIFGADAPLGGTLEAPGQLPLLAGLLSRGAAAILLVAAGWAATSRRVPAVHPVILLVLPAAAVLAILAVGAAAPDRVVELVPADVLRSVASDPTAPLPSGSAPLFLVLHSVVAITFLGAALFEYRAFLRSTRPADALLAAGLLVAAFSQLHSAIHPGSYSGLVTTADLLRLAFYALLLVGVVAESRRDISDLRAATAEVRRLAAAQFAAAGMEERARLAREIHDGLAQDLWYAKLKHSRLEQLAAFEGEQRELSGQVTDAIDAALSEARHAIAAIRAGSTDGPFTEILERVVADFNDRFAIRATLEVIGPAPQLPARTQAEALRIVQEALTNVRRHADATVVRVQVSTDGAITIVVADNGRGFRTQDVGPGFGLESMQQRAALIGAALSVASEPQNGTRVTLEIPRREREEGTLA